MHPADALYRKLLCLPAGKGRDSLQQTCPSPLWALLRVIPKSKPFIFRIHWDHKSFQKCSFIGSMCFKIYSWCKIEKIKFWNIGSEIILYNRNALQEHMDHREHDFLCDCWWNLLPFRIFGIGVPYSLKRPTFDTNKILKNVKWTFFFFFRLIPNSLTQFLGLIFNNFFEESTVDARGF